MHIKKNSSSLKKKISTLFLVFKRKDTPLLVKILTGLTVAYAISPIDILPDTIPLLGYIDDIIILPILITVIINLIPKKIREECEKVTLENSENKSPKKWYFSTVAILFWILMLIIIIYKIMY